jgi:hypothetical protein
MMEEKFIGAFREFREKVNNWCANNDLTPLGEYKELQKKDFMGKSYRDDQLYFEQVAKFKAKFFSVRSYINKEMYEAKDRSSLRVSESILQETDDEIKRMDSLINVAKQRLKFYESVIYLVSNMAYGDF